MGTQTAKSTSTAATDLPAAIFDVQTNVPLIHQVVVAQLAAARQGTHATKTRGEVRGGGRKPYRQKGTGRARQGSTRAPQFTGGGIVHGPQPRDYAQRTPKKMKAAALRGALSDRARHGRVHVVDSLVTGEVPSTKSAQALLAGLTERPNLLVVLERADIVSMKSVRNLSSVHVLAVDQLNTYDVLCADDVVFTRGALDALSAGPVGTGSTKTGLTSTGSTTIDATSDDSADSDSTSTGSATTTRTDASDEASQPAAFVSTSAAEATGEANSADAATNADDADLANDGETVTTEAKPGDFGPESRVAIEGEAAPEDFDVKGNADSMKYHVPGSRWYDVTEAEVWFSSAEAARAAGFDPAGGEAAQQIDQEGAR